MSDTPLAYPLSWPAGRRRSTKRRDGRFTKGGRWLTNADGLKRIKDEVRRLGGTNLLVSSNVALRLDGMPRSGQGEPADKGVCIYFTLDGAPYAMACDAFTLVADNMAGIAGHIEAMRAQERYGVATAKESLQVFTALPAPGAIVLGGRSCWDILGLSRGATEGEVQAAYRTRSRLAHPDTPGGSDEAMAELNAARDAALKEIGR